MPIDFPVETDIVALASGGTDVITDLPVVDVAIVESRDWIFAVDEETSVSRAVADGPTNFVVQAGIYETTLARTGRQTCSAIATTTPVDGVTDDTLCFRVREYASVLADVFVFFSGAPIHPRERFDAPPSG